MRETCSFVFFFLLLFLLVFLLIWLGAKPKFFFWTFESRGELQLLIFGPFFSASFAAYLAAFGCDGSRVLDRLQTYRTTELEKLKKKTTKNIELVVSISHFKFCRYENAMI